MAGRRKSGGTRGRSSRRTKRSPWRRTARFVFLHLALWSALAFAAYWLWLDYRVSNAFEHRRWALPARVYARPLELYPGAAVDRARLEAELERLGYARVETPRAVGEYSVARRAVEFHARGYPFWDAPEPRRAVRVTFAAAAVAGLVDVATGAPVALMRLEPAEIARINPRRYEDRVLLSFDELPRAFVAGLVAVEDRRFFEHVGVDLAGLARALWVNVRERRIAQGGSTLTQQLVKNLYLTRDRTLVRKFNEVLMALSLERRYSKRDILETYVNEVFLGQDGNRAIHGFGLAARFYFGRPLGELTTGEIALLIGMVKGPSLYDPRRAPEAARRRRDVVLGLLADAGVVAPAEAARMREAALVVRTPGDGGRTVADAFIGLVHRQLGRDYSREDLNTAGLKVYTTVDPELQAAAGRALPQTLARLEQRPGAADLQGAVVVAEPVSGEVLALVGDRVPGRRGFNRALDARRPVGSVIKPFVYARALADPAAWSLMSVVPDAAVEVTDARGQVWRPTNFDGREHGDVTLLHAFERSLNLATVQLGLRLGVDEVVDHLRKLGLGRDVPRVPAVLLGAVELTPYEVAEAFTILANDGFRVPLRAIAAVTGPDNRKLTRYGLKQRAVMDPAAAALVRFAMTRAVAAGTGRALQSLLPDALPLAGKTGTSNDHRDSWFAGFGANRLAVAWVGRDDNAPTGLTGASGALRVWAATMAQARTRPVEPTLPAGVEWRRVDPALAGAYPRDCDAGLEIPVHIESALPQLADCDGRVETPAKRGVVDRLRDWFR